MWIVHTVQHAQVVSLFTLAIADGFVSPEELALIHLKGKELGLSSREIDDAIKNPHRVPFEALASLVDAIARLYDLACVLLSDGSIDPREVEVMRSYARRFGIQESLIDRVVSALIDEVRAGTDRNALIAALSEEVNK